MSIYIFLTIKQPSRISGHGSASVPASKQCEETKVWFWGASADRFEKDNQTRIQIGLEEIKIDNRLLEALEQGLQPCAGVAIGLDRLLMKILDIKSLSDVMTFSHERS